MAGVPEELWELVEAVTRGEKTVKRSHLEAILCEELGWTNETAKVFTDRFFDAILTALGAGQDVCLFNFGTFAILNKDEKLARNLQTGEPVTVRAHKAVSFHPSGLMSRLTAEHQKEAAQNRTKALEGCHDQEKASE